MFQLIDGREYLWQWDINRQVKVEDPAIDEVHFCNRTSDCSLVVEVKDGVADIPNILLQQDFPIKVYAYLKDGYTKVEECLKIKSRTKPSDYIYTETEVITVQTIEQRMTELEERVDLKIDDVERTFEENLEQSVEDYLERNPVDMTDYSKVGHKHATGDINNFDVRVGDLVTTFWRDTGKDYVDISSTEIQEAVVEILGLPDGYDSTILGDIDQTLTDAKAYTDEAVDNIDLTGYADKVHFHQTSDVTGLQTYVDNRIDAAWMAENKGKDYVDDSISQLEADFVEVLGISEYNPDSDKNIVERIEQTLTDAKAYTDEAIANFDIPEGGNVDLTNYYTKEEVDEAIDDNKQVYYLDMSSYQASSDTTQEAPQQLIDIYEAALAGKEIAVYVYTGKPKGYDAYRPAQIYVNVTSNLVSIREGISDAVLPSILTSIYQNIKDPDIFAQISVRNTDGVINFTYLLVNPKIASTDYVDNAIANIEIPEGGGSQEVYYLDLSQISDSSTSPTEEQIAFFERILAGEKLAIYVKYAGSYDLWVPVEFYTDNNKAIQFLIHHSGWDYSGSIASEIRVICYQAKISFGSWRISKLSDTTTTLATTDEVRNIVNQSLANIGTAEGGSY